MWHKYDYFITLTESSNLSEAAEKLNISHQRISKYLKDLEKEFGIVLFERKPVLKLTADGQALLETIHHIELLELNLKNLYLNRNEGMPQSIRLGVPAGRYRLIFPDVLLEFKRKYPNVRLDITDASSFRLNEQLLKYELDMALMNGYVADAQNLSVQSMLSEKLYFVVSDHMLEKYLPLQYPDYRSRYCSGIPVKDLQNFPVTLNLPYSISRQTIDFCLRSYGVKLNCLLEIPQPDVHIMLAARDYTACFCWEMYLATVHQLNRLYPQNHLNAFPVQAMGAHNEIVLAWRKGRVLTECDRNLAAIIRNYCSGFMHKP